jgi:HAD superfamily hydrolase (TIGR01549 family)
MVRLLPIRGAALTAPLDYDSAMRPVHAIFLDLDGTLLDYDDDAWLSTVRRVCETLAPEFPDLDAPALAKVYPPICLGYWRSFEGGVVRGPDGAPTDGVAIWREHWQEALDAVGCRTPGVADRAVAHYRADRKARYRLYADAVDTLAALRPAVTALALITNGPVDTQQDKIVAADLERWFDAVVISGELGVAKPEPAIFQAAANRVGVPVDGAWHIGDSLLNDVGGAYRAGLGAAVWINRDGGAGPTQGPAPHLEIRSLRELIPLVVR